MSHWVLHRARALGMPTAGALADESGIALETVEAMLEAGSLNRVGRSARGYLARALKVSLRDLESLDAGSAQWIPDARRVDLDRLSPAVARSLPVAIPQAIACAAGRGMPVFGRITEGGAVEHCDDWTPLDGRRLRVRYPGIPDAFALELAVDVLPHYAGASLAFQVIAPAGLQPGELALLTRGDSLAETRLCEIERIDADILHLLAPSELRVPFPPAAVGVILRAGRILGAHT
ncbi:MAG TPA: hypothetical protein VG269_07090 [Tepidisphaeraceae bacterium]|jgi:hypothetical protein|nr:hypothetical protein [Tepidisphaeraceae bacterium]